MYLLVYVDDIILISLSNSVVDDLISALGTDFTVKDLGNLHFFFGLEVVHRDNGLVMA
jgi:histone deacetylase 1/2